VANTLAYSEKCIASKVCITLNQSINLKIMFVFSFFTDGGESKLESFALGKFFQARALLVSEAGASLTLTSEKIKKDKHDSLFSTL